MVQVWYVIGIFIQVKMLENHENFEGEKCKEKIFKAATNNYWKIEDFHAIKDKNIMKILISFINMQIFGS